MDTDSLCPVFAKRELEDCKQPEKKTVWEQLRSKDCTDSFTAHAVGKLSSPECAVTNTKKSQMKTRSFQSGTEMFANSMSL